MHECFLDHITNIIIKEDNYSYQEFELIFIIVILIYFIKLC